MGSTTLISWTDATWNFARGCRKVDKDCKFCYMYCDSLKGTRYDPQLVKKSKTKFFFPDQYKKTKSDVWGGRPLIFSASLSDIALEEIDSYRHEIWEIIRRHPELIFQILTKRPERLPEILPPDWGPAGYHNVWLGTSVGHQKATSRIEALTRVNASVRFVSFEPLWEKVDLNTTVIDLSKIDWAILGGESGNENGQYRYRPAELQWFETLIEQLSPYPTAVFVKQLGTYLANELQLSRRHGDNLDEWPAHLQLKQFPPLTKYDQLVGDNGGIN